MRGVFDEQEAPPAQARRDTELTLGSGTLLALFLGLVLLCSLCFGLGYSIGHRSPQSSTAVTQPVTSAGPVEADASISKPAATTQAAPPAQADPADSDAAAPADPSGTTSTADAQTLPPAVQSAVAPGQPQVHPALLQPVAVAGQPAAPAGEMRAAIAPGIVPGSVPGSVPAAAAPAGSMMVQIAAVSNSEDADVLTGALRKHGYAVTERRDPADNLIHVRIGPFATAAEANGWKMKLLNDGYNAVVQP